VTHVECLTKAPIRSMQMSVSDVTFLRAWVPDRRLRPWIVFDLERAASIVVWRENDLTEDEWSMVHNAAVTMLAAFNRHRAMFPSTETKKGRG
jgi:hypothetical protein